MRYQIGDTVYWVESSCNYQKTIPCTMCFGKRFVTIILGDDSQTKVACGFCERGMEGSTGLATTWEPNARVESGTISGVSTKDGTKYEIGYRTIREADVFQTKEIAEIICAEMYKVEVERAEEWFKDNFIRCSKKQIWSAGYHKKCIKEAERTISWHQLRLGIIKTPAPQKGQKE